MTDDKQDFELLASDRAAAIALLSKSLEIAEQKISRMQPVIDEVGIWMQMEPGDDNFELIEAYEEMKKHE